VGVALGSHAAEEAEFFLGGSWGSGAEGIGGGVVTSSGGAERGRRRGRGAVGLTRFSVTDQGAFDEALDASPLFARVQHHSCTRL